MNINLRQLIPALTSLGANTAHIELAISELGILQEELNEIEVKGRDKVDTLLGCMMAIDAIIGKEADNGR